MSKEKAGIYILTKDKKIMQNMVTKKFELKFDETDSQTLELDREEIKLFINEE